MPYIGKKPADIIATAVDTTTGTFSGDLTVDTSTLYVDSANNRVGVGTVSPSYILDIQGQNAGTDAILRVKTLGTQTYSDAFLFLETAGSGISGIHFGDSADSNVGLINYDHSDNSLYIRTNATEAMRIDSSGRVMIGTTTEGAANEAEELTIAGTGGVGMTIRSTDSGTSRIYFSDGTSGTSEYAGYQIYNHSSNAMIFGTNAIERMRIDSSGNVGIGSSSPSVPLELQMTQTGGAPATSGTTQTYGILRLQGTTFTSSLDFGTNGGNYAWIQSTDQANLATNYALSLNPNGGRVGIGTAAMTRFFNVYDTTTNGQTAYFKSTQASGGAGLLAYNDTGQAVTFQLNGSSNTAYGGANTLNIGSLTNNPVVFVANNAERMRIDSSGNFFVAKTTLDYDTPTGHVLRADGFYSSVRSGGNCVDFNRLSSDGEIIRLSKDGTTVGSIGTASSDLTIFSSTGNHKGLRFGNGQIVPTNNAGADSDNTTDLGGTSNRFKNLYLSSGVYLGGTGSANLLDDYEEGTWTATLIGSSSNPSTPVTATCNYTKIGQTVYVNGQLSNFNNAGASGAVRITGIPFTANPGSQATGNVMIQNAASWAGTNTANISPYFTPSYIGFYGSQSAGGWFEISHNVSAGSYISFSGIYKV